ncbi:hypothetical protein Tcan_00217 [Toxocara canis]|uniref:Uncharacterized protein n=1 Tax=Toxocara canis TaxID=6265 RepID=A0A0B2V871_TOXCA|nr:hypothetical protein Tcan_00217 [Toxocara canis]
MNLSSSDLKRLLHCREHSTIVTNGMYGYMASYFVYNLISFTSYIRECLVLNTIAIQCYFCGIVISVRMGSFISYLLPFGFIQCILLSRTFAKKVEMTRKGPWFSMDSWRQRAAGQANEKFRHLFRHRLGEATCLA